MSNPEQVLDTLQAAVRDAVQQSEPLRVFGNDTKAFYGRPVVGTDLSVRDYRGIVNYQPTELVVTARAGTRLGELEQTLQGNGQMLPFEPPHFGSEATFGGAIATGLSGPARPYAGAARDFVLGVKVLNGAGEVLRFGGEVIKNVAGFDVSRLMTGALGTLGILLEISVKVLPKPRAELTLVHQVDTEEALSLMRDWGRKASLISASTYLDGRLITRWSGSPGSIAAVAQQLGGDRTATDPSFWTQLREHRLDFFADPRPLWRLSLPPATPPLPQFGDCCIDWAGAQRWLVTEHSGEEIRALAAQHGGHATLFRRSADSTDENDIFGPLAPASLTIQQRLKQAFDPHRVFNPGRAYADI